VIGSIAIVAVVVGCAVVGATIGKRRAEREGDHATSLSTIQGGMLGLMGLLIALAFSGAMDRFVLRQHGLTRESNAIGTAFLRADLLEEPHRTRLRDAMRGYAAARVRLFEARDESAEAKIRPEAEALLADAWSACVAGVAQTPSVDEVVVPSINDVIDQLGERDALERRRVPLEIRLLIVLSAGLSMVMVASSIGRARRDTRAMIMALAVLVALTICATVDLDHPRDGFIRLDAAPLRDIAARLAR
jgi:hypothetical protein